MSTRAVTDEQLQAIADAIRLKTDNPAPMSVADMPLQIGLIPSGGVVIKDLVLDSESTQITIPTHSERVFIWRDDMFVTPSPSQPANARWTISCLAIKGMLVNNANFESSWIGMLAIPDYTGGYASRGEAIFTDNDVTFLRYTSAYNFKSGLYHYIEF